MTGQSQTYLPAGRLVPVFCANDHMRAAELTLSLAKTSAAAGESVLLVDCQSGELMQASDVDYDISLADVLFRGAEISDAKYVTPHENFTAIAAGEATLESVLGSLAALSLEYDWVFVGTSAGCTPSHVRLAGAADMSLLAYDSASDNFMRAYWMVDACRQRYPKFDPLLLSIGDAEQANESAKVLTSTIAEFLGAPPPYMGHMDNPEFIDTLITSLQDYTPHRAVA